MLRTDCCAILGCLEKLFATRGEEKVKKKRKERNKLKMMTMKQSKLIIKYHLFIDSRCFFLPLVRGCLLLGTLTLLVVDYINQSTRNRENNEKTATCHHYIHKIFYFR